MSNIVNFDSDLEFKKFRLKKASKEIGGGSQGSCYLGKDGLVYKDLTEGYFPPRIKIDNVITSADISLESFIFPNVLFSSEGYLIGYTSKYISENLLNNNYIFNYGIDHIDFNKLISSYYQMINDALLLAEKNIKIMDLSYNIMFDGNKLYAIDTDYYEKVDFPVFEHNKICVNNALKDEFTMIADNYFDEYISDLADSMSTVDFLYYVRDKYSQNKAIQYIKTKQKTV